MQIGVPSRGDDAVRQRLCCRWAIRCQDGIEAVVSPIVVPAGCDKCRVGLAVRVDQEHSRVGSIHLAQNVHQTDSEVRRGRRFANAALVVGEYKNTSH